MQYFQFVFPLNDGLLSDNVDGPEVWQGNYDARQFHRDKWKYCLRVSDVQFVKVLHSIVADGNETPKHVPFLKKENYFSKEIVTARDATIRGKI